MSEDNPTLITSKQGGSSPKHTEVFDSALPAADEPGHENSSNAGHKRHRSSKQKQE